MNRAGKSTETAIDAVIGSIIFVIFNDLRVQRHQNAYSHQEFQCSVQRKELCVA